MNLDAATSALVLNETPAYVSVMRQAGSWNAGRRTLIQALMALNAVAYVPASLEVDRALLELSVSRAYG